MSTEMSALLEPILLVYDYTLQPLDAFAWTGAPVTLLDLIGAFRLALVMRQMRENQYRAHSKTSQPREARSWTRDIASTLVMVYGGEAVVSSWLGIQPSFMLSGVVPGLFIGAQFIVDALPTVPDMSLTELPAAFIDAFTRAVLLCNFVTGVITTHTSAIVSASPWTLLLTSLIAANGGPFFVGLASLLSPAPMTFTTPAELLPAGWTSTDLWVAPLTTGLFATLTHAQPFFSTLHTLLFDFFSPVGLANVSYIAQGKGKLIAVDPEVARGVCVLLLAGCFVTRAVKTFSGASSPSGPNSEDERAKMRARQLSARVAGRPKEKTQ